MTPFIQLYNLFRCEAFCMSLEYVCIRVAQKASQGQQGEDKESAVIAAHILLLVIEHSQLFQEIDSFLLQCIDFLLILVPEGVAGGTGFVLPPGLVAPPPPFPISGVVFQPHPILDVSGVYFCMGFPEVRIDLLLQPSFLLDDNRFQTGPDNCQVLLASLEMLLDICDRHGHVAAGTPCRMVPCLLDQLLNASHGLEFLPAERAFALAFVDDPSLDAGEAEDVLAIDKAWVGHELETDRASEFLVGFLADNQLQVDACETHIEILMIISMHGGEYSNCTSIESLLNSINHEQRIRAQSLLIFAIAFKQLFQMNYQQHRNPPLTHSHSQQYATPYHILEPPSNPPHFPLPNLEREPSSKGSLLKLPFNANGYSEMKEYFRPQQTTITAPLTFNMQSPSKLKAKKTNRPASKLANKSYNSPFTQELQREFFKEQPKLHHAPLEDFSKTTSSVNGNSFLNFNSQQTFTEPNDDRIYTPVKLQSNPPESNKISHSNSVKILFQREPDNKPYTPANPFNHSNSSYFPKPTYEPSSAAKPRQNPPSYLLDQKFLLDEIKGLKEMNEKYQKEIMRLNVEIKTIKSNEAEKKDELRGSRKENKFQSRQLELKAEQNSKLLVQIEDMEKDLKGKVQLNRYLEHQCKTYSEKYQQLKKQFDIFKTTQADERSRQEQNITSLKKHLAEMQNQGKVIRMNMNNREGQNSQLRKALQLQGQKLQEMSTNSQIDKSQINVLTKRLENFQAKYQKLMLSHCETEGKLRNYEETHQEALIKVKKRQELYVWDKQMMESKLQSVNEEKETLCVQLANLRKEIMHLENRAKDIKSFYEEQHGIVKQDLAETNKIVESKTLENQHLCQKIEAKTKENEAIQHKLSQFMQIIEELKMRTSQKANLQTLLNEKESEIQALQVRQKFFQDDYIKISCQIEQQNAVIAGQASKIDEMMTKSARIASEKAQIMNRYDSLQGLFESQSIHLKELQQNLAQQTIQYNNIQSELEEYSSKFAALQKENDRLKQHYQTQQSQHIENLRKVTAEFEALQSKIIEMTATISLKQAQIILLSKSKLQLQTQLHQANQSLKKLSQIKLLCSEYQQRLKAKSEQTEQHIQMIKKLEQKCTQAQSQYSQLLQQTQSASQSKQAQLSSSSKSQVQTWQLLSRKEVQIQSLLSKIQILEEKVQSKTHQLHAIEQKEAKDQVLRSQIEELMIIMQENQKRSSEQKERLTKIIDGLKVELKALQEKMTEEALEYNNIIVELKASIEALQTEYANFSLLTSKKQMKTSIIQAQEPHLKQWNSLSEFQSFDSIDDIPSSRKIESAQELVEQMGEVDYIEMDREGVNYLCQLLHIDPAGGNILSQIVVRVENSLSQVQLSRKVSQSYRQVLQAFDVQEGVGSGAKLMVEITNFKQSLRLVIQQLKEQQASVQALRGECCQLRLLHEGEIMKSQRMMQELHTQGDLTHELNEIILSLNAKLFDQRLRMTEAMTLAKLSLSQRALSSEKFVTARSIGDIPACQSCPLVESDIE